MRIRSIDAFRGLSILLMVFFTLTFLFSRDLPGPITHNVPGSLHIGDFVLPMFLFASGMSLVFFRRKREGKSRAGYAIDVLERFGKLVLVSFFISPFSAGGFMHMDEVMLSAVLFLACVPLAGLPEAALAAAGLAVFALYFALSAGSALPDFAAHYLGGYPAAVFYLPVMLGGVVAGKLIEGRRKPGSALAWAAAASIAALLLFPPWKMDASPSFMALSVLLSLSVFTIMERVRLPAKGAGLLEYLGRKPIRYWVLMFALVRVPAELYALRSGSGLPLLLGWPEAVAASVACMALMLLASCAIDAALRRMEVPA